MTVIATGGLASLFHAQISVIDHADPDLTIRGLLLVHARNAGPNRALPKGSAGA
jgi:type III pantothenate kinase